MTQYLVANHHPDDYDPSGEDEAMSRDIDAGILQCDCYSGYGTHAA